MLRQYTTRNYLQGSVRGGPWTTTLRRTVRGEVEHTCMQRRALITQPASSCGTESARVRKLSSYTTTTMVCAALASHTGSQAAPGATTQDPCYQPTQGCLQPASDSLQPLVTWIAPSRREDDRRRRLSMSQVTSSVTCVTNGGGANKCS